jgi:hypothetical protein
MSRIGAAPRAAVPVSNARAEASRKNGAKSPGPRTAEGRARSSQNALKHGMRAEKHVLLPDEDAAEFAALEAALVAELAPVGALQTVLARASRPPPGGLPARTASSRTCSRSAGSRTAGPASP